MLSIALRKTLKNYTLSTFKHDLFAALVVALIALPLSMALSIAIGLPPQYGIYTAIVAGTIVPLLGGSVHQVTGPTAAFVVILAPIVTEFGLRGMIWSGLLAGSILIILGISKLGRLIHYIPYSVTTGFTAGIAVVLGTLTLNDFLGLGISHLDGHFIHKLSMIVANLPQINLFDALIGVVSLFFLFVTPNAIIPVLIGIGLGTLLSVWGFPINTIGDHFSVIPTFEPVNLLQIPSFEELRSFLFPALVIAILAALESLLSATIADSMAGTKHQPDGELIGLGIGNILSACVSGVPATGAIARTAMNIHNGGKTPLAASLHGLFILLYVLLLSPLLNYIPMSVLAALLMHTAYRMSHYKQFFRVISIAPRSDTIVLLACFFLTIFVDMIAGVGVGMILAVLLLVKRLNELTQVVLELKPDNTMIYRISGPLFFGTIEKAFDRHQASYDKVNKLIVDMSGVPFIDMSGLVAMKSMLTAMANQKRAVHIVSDVVDVKQKIQKKIENLAIKPYVFFHKNLQELTG